MAKSQYLNVTVAYGALVVFNANKKIESDMWSHLPIGSLFLSYSNWVGAESLIYTLQPKEFAYDPSGYEIFAHYPLKDYDTYGGADFFKGVPLCADDCIKTYRTQEFTSDDLKKAIELARESELTEEEIIQQITNPIPTSFITKLLKNQDGKILGRFV